MKGVSIYLALRMLSSLIRPNIRLRCNISSWRRTRQVGAGASQSGFTRTAHTREISVSISLVIHVQVNGYETNMLSYFPLPVLATLWKK